MNRRRLILALASLVSAGALFLGLHLMVERGDDQPPDVPSAVGYSSWPQAGHAEAPDGSAQVVLRRNGSMFVLQAMVAGSHESLTYQWHPLVLGLVLPIPSHARIDGPRITIQCARTCPPVFLGKRRWSVSVVSIERPGAQTLRLQVPSR